MKIKLTVNDWKTLFRDAGLDEAGMKAWHRAFEKRHPQEHAEFLAGLGLNTDEIEHIRAESR